MRRRDFMVTSALTLLSAERVLGAAAGRQQRPLPTPAQLEWQRDELVLFLHFGTNTFTERLNRPDFVNCRRLKGRCGAW